MEHGGQCPAPAHDVQLHKKDRKGGPGVVFFSMSLTEFKETQANLVSPILSKCECSQKSLRLIKGRLLRKTDKNKG